MRRRLAILAATLVTVAASTFIAVQPAHAATGFYVSNGRLYDANGSDFVMRGVSHGWNWYRGQNSTFANVKSLGANTVRVVLSTGATSTYSSASDVAGVITQCKNNKLVCVLEVHDTTGYGDTNAITQSQAADYWISIKSTLAGQEKYVIINIGNEPIGNNNPASWTSATTDAIRKMRNAGFAHTLMVDGPNWGQDNSHVMRDNAASVFNADTLHNTVFSVHMYSVYSSASTITDYLGRFVTAKLPIVVGEFGYQDPYGNVDEDTIMSTAQARGIGYLGWSWSGNGSPVQYLDMSNGFNVNSLTWWGSRVFNGANGIRATSKEASIYGGGGGGGGGGGTTTTIVGTQSGRCVDVPGNTQANGTRVTLYDCAGNANQRYEYTAAQEFKVYGSKCLDAWLNGTTNGTAVAIYDCTGGANQKWTLHSDGTITNNLSGLCLDAVGQGTTNGTLIDLWACNGQTNQKWTRR